MKTFSTAIVLAAAMDSVLAAPAQGNSLTFSATTTHTGKTRHIFHEVDRIIAKYGHPKSAALGSEAAAEKDGGGTGTVITKPEANDNGVDQLYLTEVSIGTPPQKLNLDFDTGSSDLWVFSTDTDSTEVNGQTLYRPADSSSSSLQNGQTWSIRYGDKSTSSGIVYTDKVAIGGLTFDNQAVESAQKVSQQFASDGKSSGLLGLAYDKGNTIRPNQGKTWFTNILPSLAQPLFTTRLRKQAAGSYNFGYLDQSQYTGPISYTPAFTDSLGHRLFNSTGFYTGSQAISSSAFTGTADTGTSLIVVPQAVAKSYWSNVRGAQPASLNGGAGTAWIYPCSTQLPSFSFVVGSGKAVVPGSDINYAPNGGGNCVGGIAYLSGLNGLVIIGDIAFKSGFVVYDDGKKQLGWAKGL